MFAKSVGKREIKNFTKKDFLNLLLVCTATYDILEINSSRDLEEIVFHSDVAHFL